jgi:hypothetical protein
MVSLRQFLLTCVLFVSGLPAAYGQDADDQIWTTKPTRIDRARQHFERLPAVVTAHDARRWLVVPERIKVLDSATFSFGDGVYAIANIRPVRPKRLCQSVEGGRWACGRMASIFLGNLVRGKRLLCDLAQTGDRVALSHCVIGSRDVAAAIEADAQKAAAKGLWRNPKCVADFDNC